jgi:hypothetical protein
LGGVYVLTGLARSPHFFLEKCDPYSPVATLLLLSISLVKQKCGSKLLKLMMSTAGKEID